MLARAALVALLCSTSISAWALSEPEPGRADPQMRTQAYDPLNRTMLVLTVDRSANITFSPNEVIKRVIFSHEGGPVGTIGCKPTDGPECKSDQPLVNNLPLFGKAVGKTDLIVITSMSPATDGHEQTYMFFIDVRAPTKDGGEDPESLHGLKFTYAQQEKAAAQVVAVQTWKEKRDAATKKVAEDHLNTEIFYGAQNWEYAAIGRFKNIAPVEVHDNGRITGFRYPGNMPHPSLFIVNDGHQGVPSVCLLKQPTKDEIEGTEQTAPVDVVDDMIILHQTARHLRVRSGDEVDDIWNCRYDIIGVNPGTGTSSPDVIRRVVSK